MTGNLLQPVECPHHTCAAVKLRRHRIRSIKQETQAHDAVQEITIPRAIGGLCAQHGKCGAGACRRRLAQQAHYLVVPFAPGGATDILGRTYSQALSEALGVPVVVENKPGTGGSLGLRLCFTRQTRRVYRSWRNDQLSLHQCQHLSFHWLRSRHVVRTHHPDGHAAQLLVVPGR